MLKQPLVTVALLTRNGGADLKNVVKAVFAQKTSFVFEVLAIDNSSEDGTWEFLGQFPKIRKVRIQRKEFLHGPTRDRAVELSRGEIVVFLVQDAIPVGEKWLETLVAPLSKQEKDAKHQVAGVTGRQVPPKGVPVSQRFFLLNSYTEEPKVLDGLPTEFGPGRVWFSNVDSAISKKVWQKIGFPNVIMSEDQAWARAVLAKGYRLVYEPKAKVMHDNQMTIGKVFRRNVDSGVSFATLGTSVPSVGSGRIWKWVWEELKFAFREEGLGGVCYVVLYEGARWVGFQIGYREWIPRSVKKFFSIVPWWYEQDKSGS